MESGFDPIIQAPTVFSHVGHESFNRIFSDPCLGVAAVPSDQWPTGIMNSVIGSGAPPNCWIQHNRGSQADPHPKPWDLLEGCQNIQMGKPMPGGVVLVSLARHHVAHCAGFQGWQSFRRDCLDAIDNLSFGQSSQYQLRPL